MARKPKELKQDAKELALDAKEMIIEHLREKYKDFKNLSNQEIEDKLKTILEKKDEYKEDIDDILNEVEEFVKKHPLLSIAGAFFIGWLFSK